MLAAIEASPARCGVQGYHPHPLMEALDSRPDLRDDSGEFVPEERRRHDHARVVAPLKNLEVGAVRQSDFYFDEYLAFVQTGYGYLLDLQVFFAVKYGRGHRFGGTHKSYLF